jgi:hypothetical protein
MTVGIYNKEIVMRLLGESPALLLRMSSRTLKLDEEKSKHAGLAEHTYLQRLRWLVKGTATVCTCTKECNKYDLTAAQYF